MAGEVWNGFPLDARPEGESFIVGFVEGAMVTVIFYGIVPFPWLLGSLRVSARLSWEKDELALMPTVG